MSRCCCLTYGFLATLLFAVTAVNCSQYSSNMFLNGEYQNGLLSRPDDEYKPSNSAAAAFISLISKRASPFVGQEYLPSLLECRGRGQQCVLKDQCVNGYFTQQLPKVQNCAPEDYVCCTYNPPTPPPTTQKPFITCSSYTACVAARDCHSGEILSNAVVNLEAKKCYEPNVCCAIPSTMLTENGYVLKTPPSPFTYPQISPNSPTTPVNQDYLPPQPITRRPEPQYRPQPQPHPQFQPQPQPQPQQPQPRPQPQPQQPQRRPQPQPQQPQPRPQPQPQQPQPRPQQPQPRPQQLQPRPQAPIYTNEVQPKPQAPSTGNEYLPPPPQPPKQQYNPLAPQPTQPTRPQYNPPAPQPSQPERPQYNPPAPQPSQPERPQYIPPAPQPVQPERPQYNPPAPQPLQPTRPQYNPPAPQPPQTARPQYNPPAPQPQQPSRPQYIPPAPQPTQPERPQYNPPAPQPSQPSRPQYIPPAPQPTQPERPQYNPPAPQPSRPQYNTPAPQPPQPSRPQYNPPAPQPIQPQPARPQNAPPAPPQTQNQYLPPSPRPSPQAPVRQPQTPATRPALTQPPRRVPSPSQPNYLPPVTPSRPVQSVDRQVLPSIPEKQVYPQKPLRGEDQLSPQIFPPSRPRPQPQFQEQAVRTPATCASALVCTAENYCNSIGVISETPVQVTPFRVPLTDCIIAETGAFGKCCRDSNYVDPWPVNLAGVCATRNKNTKPQGVKDIDANFAEIPWQAMVLKDSSKSLLCGGAIIGDGVVLTTASCVQNVAINDMRVKAGEWELGSTNEPLNFQLVGVKKVAIHPSFDPNTGSNDMAVLHLSERLQFASHIQPICISDKDPSASETCVTTGWGKQALSIHEEGAILHVTNTSPVSRSDCGADSSGVCSTTNFDACEFDSGSALACGSGSSVLLKGIYSVENACGEGQAVRFIKPDVAWVNQQFLDRTKPLLLKV